MAINKRAILQPILDKIEPGWTIVKPDPLNPDDIETECIFQRNGKEVRVAIARGLFVDNKIEEIERQVRSAVKRNQ